MRLITFIAISLLILTGCARTGPVAPYPLIDGPIDSLSSASNINPDHNRRLWAYGLMYVNDDHTQIEWVPIRTGNFHLNALNLLENGPCYNCVSIQNISPLGNGVLDVDIAVEHPFPGLLKYTGFDVKGIIMFDGSIQIHEDHFYKLYVEHPELRPIRFNLAIAGDWELLNEDGFSLRWTPTYDSGEEWPMFNYIEGKLSNGIPNSLVNAYKDFYSHEERHIFMPGTKITRTFRIQAQPGPATIGYAVEACWEPPLVLPVTDPVVDFPVTANQSEPYLERYFVNNDEPITAPHTEIYEYPFFAQYREWDTGYPNNATAEFHAITFIGGEWSGPGGEFPGGPMQWLYGPEPDTEDFYRIYCYPCETFTPFGLYNGYYIWLRFSWRQIGSINISNFNPSIQIVQVNIPGNDPPGG